jgi:hypothetical protein
VAEQVEQDVGCPVAAGLPERQVVVDAAVPAFDGASEGREELGNLAARWDCPDVLASVELAPGVLVARDGRLEVRRAVGPAAADHVALDVAAEGSVLVLAGKRALPGELDENELAIIDGLVLHET